MPRSRRPRLGVCDPVGALHTDEIGIVGIRPKNVPFIPKTSRSSLKASRRYADVADILNSRGKEDSNRLDESLQFVIRLEFFFAFTRVEITDVIDDLLGVIGGKKYVEILLVDILVALQHDALHPVGQSSPEFRPE